MSTLIPLAFLDKMEQNPSANRYSESKRSAVLRYACPHKIDALAELAYQHQREPRYVIPLALKEAVQERQFLFLRKMALGFVHFQYGCDRHVVPYEIAMQGVRRGIGRPHAEAVTDYAWECDQVFGSGKPICGH